MSQRGSSRFSTSGFPINNCYKPLLQPQDFRIHYYQIPTQSLIHSATIYSPKQLVTEVVLIKKVLGDPHPRAKRTKYKYITNRELIMDSRDGNKGPSERENEDYSSGSESSGSRSSNEHSRSSDEHSGSSDEHSRSSYDHSDYSDGSSSEGEGG